MVAKNTFNRSNPACLWFSHSKSLQKIVGALTNLCGTHQSVHDCSRVFPFRFWDASHDNMAAKPLLFSFVETPFQHFNFLTIYLDLLVRLDTLCSYIVQFLDYLVVLVRRKLYRVF